MNSSWAKAMMPIIAAFIVLAGIVLGLFVLIRGNQTDISIEIGIVIILGVSALVTLLFILAVGFDALKLTDPKQALGLPVGSIRAMIAIMLIVIWIILSVFLFSDTLGLDSTKNADSIRLAQQLYTTMSTLVVAIAAFYFGSSSVKAAQAGQAPSAAPSIDSIDPAEGAPGQTIAPLAITGKNFQSPVAIKLVKDANEAAGTGILSNSKSVQCTIQVPTRAKANDKLDVVVVNNDGSTATLKGAFTVTGQ